MRLDKFICKSTTLNKEQARAQINIGKVFVNSKAIVDEATQVHENNVITLNGTELIRRPFRYLMMHKPAGTICSNIDEVYPSLFNFIDIENASELHIAGRLDADTTGLVLITDDGRWSFNITVPNKQCHKVYRVTLSRDISDDAHHKFKHGILLQGELQLTKPATLKVITPKEVILTITEGKFHQVKRMFATIGNRVVSLHREQIGHVSLDIKEGLWRYLSEKEIQLFNK